MTLYDSILLLRARWRWLLLVPACSLAVTLAVLELVTPRDYVARAVVRIDGSLPVARAVAILNSRTLAERLDGRLTAAPLQGNVEVVARAATGKEAVRIVATAIATVNATELARLDRLVAERTAVKKRRDPFAGLEYQSLTAQIDRLGNGRVGLPLELVEPVTARQPSVLQPYPLLASAVASLVVVFASVFVREWWIAERAARAGRAWRARDSL